MLRNIKIVLGLLLSLSIAQAQDLRPPYSTSSGGGSGTVTSVSVTTANGVSGSVATATTTPAISLTLGAITPTSVTTGVISGTSLILNGGTSLTTTDRTGTGNLVLQTSPSLITPILGDASATTLIISNATLGTNAAAIGGSALINTNITSVPPTAITGTGLQVVGANGVTGRIEVNSFGAIAAFSAARANGTLASPTAILSGDQIGGVNAYTFVTSASSGYVGPVVSYQSFATQNHQTNAMGSKAIIATVPNNSTTLTTGLTVDQDQSVAMAGRTTIATSLAIGGATIGTDALAWTGTATGSGQLSAASFVPTSSAVPTNGMYLSAANTVSFSTNSGAKWTISSGGSLSNVATATAAALQAVNTSATAPSVVPNRSDTTTGMGAQATGNVSLIAGATERVRIATNAASVSDVLVPGTLFSGGTGTTTFPQIFVQPTGTTAATTWSTSGTVIGANVVSGFAGNFLDFHVAGGTSVFSVTSAGAVSAASSFSSTGSGFTGAGGSTFSWNARAILSSPAAGTPQLGAADVDLNSAIVAQTLRSQGALTGGTSDQAGKNLTIIVSPGKGTGIGGSFIVQTAPAGVSSATPNTPVTALTIDSTQLAIFAGGGTFASTFSNANGARWSLANVTATATVPNLITNRGDTTTGVGGAINTLSLIAQGAEIARVTATAFTQIAGQTVRKGYTIGTLPTGIQGGEAYITDQLTTCAGIGVAPTPGGSAVCPVFYNGTIWVGG